MNKYQEPFNNIVVEAELMAERCGHKLEEDIKLVQELVDRATPKKPINKTKGDEHIQYENCNIVICPHCGKRLKLKSKGKYCDKCGGALDWNKE